MIAAWLGAVAGVVVAWVWGTAQPAEPAPVTVQPATQDAIASADDLLRELETADADLRALAADLRYDRTFELAGDRQVRVGRLFFESPPGGAGAGRRFAIRFDRLELGDRLEEETKFYVFDGEWLVEKLPAEKLFFKRQVAPPGSSFDPLRIGQGPLPIPIGQKREDILSRYTADLLPSDDGLDSDALRAFALGAYQLRLVPRAETAADEEFTEVRLWYRRGADAKGPLLPRMARTINHAGDVSVVQLINVKLNAQAEIPAGVMDTASPGTGWDVQVTEYRGRGAREADGDAEER